MNSNPGGWTVDDLQLSPQAKEQLDTQYERYGTAEVLARANARTYDVVIGEKRERERLEALEAERLDYVEQCRMEGRPLRDQFAPLRDYEIHTAIADAAEERNRQAAADARAERLQADLAVAQARLAAEKRQSATAASRATRTTQAALAYRRRAEKAKDDAAWAAEIALRPRPYWR